MGNVESSSSKSGRRSSSKNGNGNDDDDVAARAQKAMGEGVRELQAGIQSGIKKLEEQDHPAAQLIDTVCGPYLDPTAGSSSKHVNVNNSFYSEDEEDDSRTISEDETTSSYYRRGSGRNKNSSKHHNKHDHSVDSQSYMSTDYDEATVETEDTRKKTLGQSYESDGPDGVMQSNASAANGNKHLKTPLASSFAKRCYFTKAGIGKTTQHYEGLTLTGNIVLMLAGSMKLKGCPTICDEDLRRVEQTYPNQFSRLPDELLLSSGWRRISKYCHFSNKPVPDGIPFFHSKKRLHPSGGYYFLLCAAVGMVRPIDVEPLSRDTLVLLETDYPTTCDAAPPVLITNPAQWTLVDKFCFFSGGPINTEEDVYYQADFDGNPIYMLAFLSPSLTPNELYKLDAGDEAGLRNVADVQEVESVYDLTERDFDDLKLYHLGPCRALPQYVLQPHAWTKVLPPHFLAARQQALMLAHDYENHNGVGGPGPTIMATNATRGQPQQQLSIGGVRGRFAPQQPYYEEDEEEHAAYGNGYQQSHQSGPNPADFQRDVDEDGAFTDPNVPIDEAIAAHAASLNRPAALGPGHKMDPPDDEPPSLSKRPAPIPDAGYQYQSQYSASSGEPTNPTYYTDGEYYSSPEKEGYDQNYYRADDETFEPEPDIDDGTFDQDALSPLGSGETGDAFDRPPMSPDSAQDSDFAGQSSAMRGAQEMLKKNRQRRLETARRMKEEQQQHKPTQPQPQSQPTQEEMDKDNVITASESGVTWDSGSEVTSVVSGSSVWTDHTNPDRSHRRALILQMAKARMKSNKPVDVDTPIVGAILEEVYETNEEEKKVDIVADDSQDTATEFDMAEDLD